MQIKFIKLIVVLISLSFLVSCSSASDDIDGDETENPDPEPEATKLDDSQNLGVNFNEQLDYIDADQLLALKTSWVRGFVDFFQFYEDPLSLSTSEKITKYLSLHTYGFKTVLNIKWLFTGKDFPATGSEEMENQMSFLKTLLDKVWEKTDIIVVGNEPFIETDDDDKDQQMYDYYVEAMNVVKTYNDSHTAKPIFFGAFDNMYQSGRQSLSVLTDLLNYASSNSWIAGVDMHIHHSTTNEMQEALAFVSERIRDDQKIMVSEFSLMKYFRSNLSGTIPSEFATRYGFSTSLKNYQYIDYALKNQVKRKQWVDFLSESTWFENRKNYLNDSFYDIFSDYDQFFLATYAFRQSYPENSDFTANTDPWVLNGLYANRTVETDPGTGRYQFNYAWAEDFISIQESSN